MREKKPLYTATNFHMQLRKVRVYRNYRYQVQMSVAVNVSRQITSLWEKGYRKPNLAQVAELANLFEVDINYFFIQDADPKDYDLKSEMSRPAAAISTAREQEFKLMPFVETMVSSQLFKILDKCSRLKGIYTINIYEDSGVSRALQHYSLHFPDIMNIVNDTDFKITFLNNLKEALLIVFENADRLPEHAVKTIIDSFSREFSGSIILVGKNIKQWLQELSLLERISGSYTTDCITTRDFNNIAQAALPDAEENIINLLRMETGVRLKNLYDILKKINEQCKKNPNFTITTGSILELYG